MSPGRAQIQRSRRWGTLALATVLAGVTVAGTADARSRRHHHRHHHPATSPTTRPMRPSWWTPIRARCCRQTNADSPRHPASLTKMMTLYLLFEQLAAGKMKLSTEMPVSAHAAAMAPTKLDLKPGEKLSVGDAIPSIVTKSANDAAVVVAEAIGGSETEFARHDDRQGARARHEAHQLPQRLRPARRPRRSPPRATRPSLPARCRTASRNISTISRCAISPITATACAITTICSAASTASTA